MKNEKQIELSFIEKLKELKYIYREDIKDKASLEENFRKHFQELNRVRLSDSEFARLKESIITPDVFSEEMMIPPYSIPLLIRMTGVKTSMK